MKMTATRKLVRVIAVAAVATLLISGCGGGSSSGSSAGTGESTAGSSSEFKDPQGLVGPERIVTFGKESGDAEREKASAVLAQNLEAREKADFATQCETLSKHGREALMGKGESDLSKCQKELEKLDEPADARANTLDGEIAALRVKGIQAYALYHGSDGKDYMMPMENEGGTWKVWSFVPVELPQ